MTALIDKRGRMLILITIGIAVVMDGLDSSIVMVALPSIASSYGIDTGTAAWVTITYFMMMAGLLLVFSKLADMGTIKKVYVTGMVIFTVFSMACGLSPTFESLLAFRILQGVGAAMLGACAPLLCVKYLPAKMIGLGMSIIALGASLGVAIGPALGGLLTHYLSWHWIFLINIPIGIAGILFAMRAIPKDAGYERTYFDVAGAALLFITVASGTFALERFTHMGPGDIWIVTSISVCVVGLILFIINELKCASPMLNVRIFASWRFDSVFTAFLLINMACMGAFYLLPFYFSLGMGLDSAASGLFLFIPPVITLIICVPIGRMSDLRGRRIFSVMACFALVSYSVIYYVIEPSMSIVMLMVALVLMGAVWGLCGGPAASRIVESVKEEDRSSGSALMIFSVYFGGTLGTAMFATFFTLFANSGSIPFADLPPSAFMSGFHGAMLISVIIAVIALILSTIVKDLTARSLDGS